jgi:hypothetical protein
LRDVIAQQRRAIAFTPSAPAPTGAVAELNDFRAQVFRSARVLGIVMVFDLTIS